MIARCAELQAVVSRPQQPVIVADVGIRDVILAVGACTDSNVNRRRYDGKDFAAVADFGLLRAAAEAGRPVLLIAHSMGSVIAFDALWQMSRRDGDAVHLDTSYSDAMRTRAGSGPIPRRESTDSRLLVDLKVEYGLSERFKLWGQLINATNEVYVAARRPAGLRPGRPRAALFGLSLEFPG